MSVRVFGADEAGLAQSVECVHSGNVLLFPTETVYGLGGDAEKGDVANRIRALKGSESGKPLLVLTDEWPRVAEWIDQTNPLVGRLLAVTFDLPITWLLPVSEVAPNHLSGEDALIGIRRTSNSFCRELIARTEAPLLSTSANMAGGQPPAEFERIESEIVSGADVAIDANRPLQGVPSTIVRFNGKTIHIVREGALDVKTIHEILGMA